ncbi:hypothetical protein CCP4SC76_70002 [Gammaproteobacteria bacterium]
MSPTGLKFTVTPRAMTIEEIRRTVLDFQNAAKQAIASGFDGIEIHASNGYLLHQFFAGCSNHREDAYGGSYVNRARILIEILEAVAVEMPINRVGVRLNPMMNRMHGIRVEEDTLPIFEHLVKRLADYDLAYLHLTEPFLPDQLKDTPDAIPEVARHFRDLAHAPVVVNGGFDQARAESFLTEGLCQAVAFGRPFIANPDLVLRFRHAAPLNTPDPSTFYQGGEKGYLDYPMLA